MGSTFSWMDHSDAEHRRVLEAIDKFKESEARDELGLGTVRDVFADTFFPGTSTIQTRLRYFLFIPWVYRELEKKRAAAGEIAQLARKAETSIAAALKSTGQDERGIIGARAGDAVKRLPSSIYWLGLSSWKIRLFDGPMSAYHRAFGRQARDVPRDDDREPLDGGPRPAWDPSLPTAPRSFPKDITFDLSREEADYVSGRIQRATPRSLLAHLVRSPRGANCSFAWEHSGFASWREDLRAPIEHARLFAEAMHGAAWLYNLLMAEKRALSGTSDDRERVDHYRTQLASWATELQGRAAALDSWDRAAFWRFVLAHAPVPHSTQRFVEGWLHLRAWDRADGGADHTAGRQLIIDRERDLKGERARLSNARALELWGGASGTSRLDFRWGVTQRLLTDFFDAYTREAVNAGAA